MNKRLMCHSSLKALMQNTLGLQLLRPGHLLEHFDQILWKDRSQYVYVHITMGMLSFHI
jgi:hypothetical protein